jgi:hypothetical protein
MVTNTEFKGTTGWVGTYYCNPARGEPNKKNKYGITIEAVYGRFRPTKEGGVFSSVADELANGDYDETT